MTKEILIDLIAGLIGAAILGGVALVFNMIGPERRMVWANKLRRLAWPLLAFVFFVTALMSAILQPPPRPIVVALGTILVLVIASVIMSRFGSLRIRQQISRMRAYAWPILTGLFFLSTVMLLIIGIIDPTPPSKRITFVVDLAVEEWMVLRDTLDELEEELGAEVFLMKVDSSRYVAHLHKMEASGEMGWDLIAVDNNMTGILAARSLVEELPNELIPDTLIPSLRPLCKSEFDDKLYFVPFRPNVKIAFYNEPKFTQYGLRQPMTWEELLDRARVFKKKEGVGRVAIQGAPGKPAAVTVFEFVKAAGGNPLTLDDEGSRTAFEFLQQLEPYLAKDYGITKFDTANEFLISNEVYLVSNWTYTIKVVVEDAGKKEIEAYRGWRGPEREVHVLGGDVLAVPKGAPHRDEAIKLIELLLGKETQQKLLSRLRWLPARLDAYYGISDEMTPYFKAVNEALPFAVLRPTMPQWPMVERVLASAFQGLVRDSKDIAELKEYSDRLKEIPTEYIRYEVKPEDTLAEIARGYKTEVDFLAEINGIKTWTPIAPGQILLIPEQ